MVKNANEKYFSICHLLFFFFFPSIRKICLNCRCGKDDHEVEEDEEDIGKIVIGKLFERPIRTKEEEESYSYGNILTFVTLFVF